MQQASRNYATTPKDVRNRFSEGFLTHAWLTIQFIRIAVGDIIFNIFSNTIQLILIPDNTVMKTGLPTKWNPI